NLVRVHPGFRENGVLAAHLELTQLNLPVNRRLVFKQEILRRLRAVPGVSAAAEAGPIPLSGSSTSNRVWSFGSDRKHGIDSSFSWISPKYVNTIERPQLAGCDFDTLDKP